MPRPYSADLRERVLTAWERREGTQAAIARRFSVGGSTIENWLRQARREGRRGPKPPAGGPRPRLTADALAVLHALVLEDNAATLQEYADRLAARIGVRVSPPVLCRAPCSAGPRALPGVAAPRSAAQKKTLRASEQDRAEIAAERTAYRQHVDAIGPERLVFLDESGVTTTMTRRFARAPRGQRALGSVPFGGWQRLTIIGALSREGMIAAMSVDAPMNAALLRVYLDEVLVPELQRQKPDAVLVMDNLRPHHATAVAKTLERAHLELLDLPRYSPDLSPLAQAALALTAAGGARLRREPIEPGWSKVKTRLRTAAARTTEALEAELRPALDAITPQDAQGWFRHCGYSLN